MIKLQEYKITAYEIIGGYVSLIILIVFSNEIFVENMAYNYIPLVLIVVVYLYRYKSVPTIYLKILMVFLLYNLIHLAIYHDVHPMFFFRYLFYISLAFFTIRFNFNNFFERLEKIIYYGAFISLPLFILQNLIFSQFFSTMSSLQHFLGITSSIQHDGLYYSNTLFYTINTTNNNRNCGFMFEPGAFGSLLAIAIGLNLIHNNFKLKNKRLIILVIALITTQSTTAFLALICVILFYLVNKGLKKGIILIPVGVILIYFLFQLPFMSKKISDLSDNPDKQLNQTIQLGYDSQRTQSLGRFAGLLLNYEDFRKSPVFGIGGHDAYTEKAEHHWDVNSVNGLGNYLVTFGLFGILFLIFNLSKTFSSVTMDSKLKGNYYLVLMVLVISFSFMLIETPLFFSFQIYYVSRVKMITGSDLNIVSNKLRYFPG
jgi:hypothetical protein